MNRTLPTHPGAETFTRSQWEMLTPASRKLLELRGCKVVRDPIDTDFDEEDDGTEPLSEDFDDHTKIGIGQ